MIASFSSCDATCCSVLYCITVVFSRCSVLQCVVVFCSELQYAQWMIVSFSSCSTLLLQCVAVCCSALQCVSVGAVCCSVSQCSTVSCSTRSEWQLVSRVSLYYYGSVLQCVAVSCKCAHVDNSHFLKLQCVAVCDSMLQSTQWMIASKISMQLQLSIIVHDFKTYSNVRQDPFSRVTGLILMFAMIPSYAWHDSFSCVTNIRLDVTISSS